MVALQRERTLNLIRCTVGTTVVGFDLGRVVSVERGERLLPCPAVPGAVGRIANRAGDWTVYPLAWWLGAEPGDPRGAQVVLFETPRGRFGLAVDRVSSSVRVERSSVFSPPTAVGFLAAALISGVAVLDAAPLVLLNPDNLDPGAPELSEPPARRPRALAPRAARGQRLLAIGCIDPSGKTERQVSLCLPSENVVEIVNLEDVAPVPTGDEHVRGVIAWRGRPLPVLDPACWLGLASARSAVPRAVVVSAGARVALTAGADVRLVPATTPVIPTRRHLPVRLERTLGVFDSTDETFVVPDWNALLGL